MINLTGITIFLGLSALLSFGAAVFYLIDKRPGMALTFLCYAISNVGLIWDAS